MTNENVPAVFGGSVDIADTSSLVAAMEETKDDGARGGDVSFMSFSGKMGTFKIGAEGRSLDEGEIFLVAIPMFELGWICWKGGKPIAKRMANIKQPKVAEPAADEGGPFESSRGEGWSRARAITLRSMQRNEQLYFTNNSKSGVSEFADLQKQVMERIKTKQPCWPAIQFKAEQFTADGYKNFKPSISYAGWLSTDDVMKLSDPDVDPMSLLNADADAGTPPEPNRRL